MIKTVVSVGLPVDENMIIRKNTLIPEEIKGDEKRICIVTGTHGDEVEGQYVCYELNRIINSNIDKLKGIVDIYPALNPLGIDSIQRGIPMFDLDMNRIFPGNENGAMAEHVASQIISDIKGADMCIDIHASNIFLREIPQVRINENNKDTLMNYAKLLNTDFIWVHGSATVLEATLAYSLNSINVPTLVVEMGVGMRITEKYCNQLVVGIFRLMKEIGIWAGETKVIKEPIISTDREVGFANANSSGIFIPKATHWSSIKKGELIGDILNALTGEIEEKIYAPCDGLIFTLREYPVVYTGSLIARVIGGVKND
ncbi:M14 family metallopeptidase [Clostridium butyricum]|uniref:M14 family metallopeptidase n=1 Tax=Clostridium butyricum TaxID=1492 RepID=UPI0003D681BA|nr:MAG: Succinylglutamate desuccinylase / Aspartoacylase family [Clostridium butyricum DORA_1]MDU1507362.1 M14 family metallopeptidase [Clostridium butyricum]MDU4801040.1 M14 family metallopeptidase [Clostridium butyricum]MDU5721666.1 M14 family metallopeptidase [Clostridium butyricum]MDU5819333.1 M14 family metallopeptidase [Clostridium butyricum]